MSSTHENITPCYHCGEPCEEELIEYDNKTFCCQGCKMVYEILQENDLCNYYDLQQSPGITLKNRDFKEKFAYLDNEDIQQQLLSYASDTLNKVVFYVPAIHCSSCIWLLEHLDTLRPGIVRSRVNFVRKEVSIDFDPRQISLKTVVELLATVGYEPEINLESHSDNKKHRSQRRLMLQIGLAGFSFGNIMLLSFPEYLGFEGLNPELQRFFSWASLALSLPVVFFSALDYFISAWKGLRQRYMNIDVPIVLGILTLFGRSLYDILTASGPGYLDSLSGLVFFLLIGKWVQSKTYESLSFERNYKSYFPLAVHRLQNGRKEVVQITELQAGDLIEVRNREVIPADAELLSEQANIDYSFVTGEAATVIKSRGEHIYAGGRQIGYPIQLKIVKAVSQSYLTQLWNTDTFEETTRYDSLIDRISKYFTVVVLLIAALTGLWWYLHDPSLLLNAVTAVLIVACPCALSLATPFTLGNAMAILGRHKLYLKHMNVLEKIWYITTVVFDKTGTLTRGSSGHVHFHGRLSADEKNLVAAAAAASTHPLSRQIAAELLPAQTLQADRFHEHEGQGLEAEVGGHIIRLGSAAWTGATPPDNNRQTRVYLSIDDQPRGYFTFGNVYRQHIEQAIATMQKHYRLVVLSGDNEGERANLEKIFPANTPMVFGQEPAGKLAYIRQLQQNGEQVMMFGDGLNDAGALRQADVGIAVAEDVSAFTPASDAILFGGSMPLAGRFLQLARLSRLVIYSAFAISFLYNVIGLSFAVSGRLTPLFAAILMPLSSITVVAFATFAIRGLARKLKL